MKTLRLPPFSLSPGDLIVARVSAITILGKGAPSPPNKSGVRVARAPYKMTAPSLVRKSADSITVTWKKIAGVLSYRVEWEEVGVRGMEIFEEHKESHRFVGL